jgi:hypothetical protein
MTTTSEQGLGARAVVTMAFVLVAACGGGALRGDRGLGTVQQNGLDWNGLDWNGLDWNGLDWNGAQLIGISVNEMRLNDNDITHVYLDGTVIHGTDSNRGELSGAAFVGAQLRGLLSHGGHVALRIDAYAVSEDPDISLYALSYWSPSRGWSSLCGTDNGQQIMATALSGRWNYAQGEPGGGSHIQDDSAFTFACEHSVLEKCTAWGYKPWQSDELADLHQACTRMVRADYCGDGTPHTVNGTPINYFDHLGIAVDDAPSDWIGDGEWNAAGALCVANLRHPEMDEPACYAQLHTANCVDSSHFGQGAALLMNKIEPR